MPDTPNPPPDVGTANPAAMGLRPYRSRLTVYARRIEAISITPNDAGKPLYVLHFNDGRKPSTITVLSVSWLDPDVAVTEGGYVVCEGPGRPFRYWPATMLESSLEPVDNPPPPWALNESELQAMEAPAPPPPAHVRTPRIGSIVLYVPSDQPWLLPAIVVFVHPDATLDLSVFGRAGNLRFRPQVPGNKPGEPLREQTWTWPLSE